jgi:hypothetical protein
MPYIARRGAFRPLPRERAWTKHDCTALDRIMPHPVHAPMAWVCVLDPGEATWFASVKPLLDEA